jgi:predicted Zn-dependent protease with MMP-like domain
MVEVTPERFEEMVAQAVNALPPEFAERIDNVEFVVEEYAVPSDYGLSEQEPGSVLLGVYRGVPLTRRTSGYHMAAPDKIVIFRGPLQRLASSEFDLERRVARVVRHEIAHHFGISDERLREIDAY